ncbi:MAG: glycerophosphodiester phosphodiesterase [Geminicoccaceae bacterium]
MQQQSDQVRAPSWREAGDGAPLRLPRVIGHRGAAGAAPENTLSGIRKAKELGASWIEFDVKLTKDGQAILFHDDRLERTTDGHGPVAATTLAEIRRLDAGGWFGPAFHDEPIPTFDEALMLCVELGLGINVEIKPCRHREAETAAVAMATLRHGWPQHMPVPVVSSFAPECLRVAREIAPELPRGYLARRLPRNWQALMADYGCVTLHLDQRWLQVRQRSAVTAAGVPLVLYTVNEGERARQHLESGVTSVITDQIDRVSAAIGAGPGASTAARAQR